MDSKQPNVPWRPREITILPPWQNTSGNDVVAAMHGDAKYVEYEAQELVRYWVVEASDEELIAAVYGWHMRALNVPTALDYDTVSSVFYHRLHLRDDDADPDDAAFLHELGVHGDDMIPGFLLTNAGIEEDTLARIYLRVIRVHGFLARFTADDEVDGIFNPDGIHRALFTARDELLLDTFNWLWLHQTYGDGSVAQLGRYPKEAELRIADESELIRRQFGYAEELCGEHPSETPLALQLTDLQARYRPATNAPVERVRRKRGYKPLDSFWTADRIQAALDLGMEN